MSSSSHTDRPHYRITAALTSANTYHLTLITWSSLQTLSCGGSIIVSSILQMEKLRP